MFLMNAIFAMSIYTIIQAVEIKFFILSWLKDEIHW